LAGFVNADRLTIEIYKRSEINHPDNMSGLASRYYFRLAKDFFIRCIASTSKSLEVA